MGRRQQDGCGSATVTDDQIGLNETLTDGDTFTGSEEYTCSSTASDYAGDGKTTFSESNTAIVTSGGAEEDRDSATETINCYAPVISKTAAGTYDERHEWDVEKTASPASQNAFAGDTVSYEWTVTVVEDVFEEHFVASGKITIVNHNDEDAMTVRLSDVLSDATAATITACTGDANLSDGLTITAGGTSVCDYTASLIYDDVYNAPTNNTATAIG